MPNGMYGGVRGRKTKVGRKLLLFSSYSIVYTLSTNALGAEKETIHLSALYCPVNGLKICPV